MPIFISYSRQDQAFVTNLAAALVKKNVHIWVDTWELKVGDSIISKVQDAIKTSSALIIVLSKSSVNSEWCKKELNSGLIRELEEKQVIVLPALIEHCEIPLFLREKLYADFRTRFDEGLNSLLESIAPIINMNLGRLILPETNVYWAFDWGYIAELFQLRFTLVDHNPNFPFVALVEMFLTCNEKLTQRYKKYESIGLDWIGRNVLVEIFSSFKEKEELFVVIEDRFPQIRKICFADKKRGLAYDLEIKSRILGEDTGKNILINLFNYLENIRIDMHKSSRKMTNEETIKILNLLKSLD